MENLQKLSIFCKRSSILKGNWSNIQDCHVDSKWINISCHVVDCHVLKLTAWAVCNTGPIGAQIVLITVLGVLVNMDSIVAEQECHVVSTFVLSLAEKSEILQNSHSERPGAPKICSLGLFTRDSNSKTDRLPPFGTNYLWLNFTTKLAKMGGAQVDFQNFKTFATMLRDRWMTSSLDADEILIGLKYISDLQEIRWNLDISSQIYEKFVEISEKFENSPISLFNYGELVNLVQGVRGAVPLVQVGVGI